MWKVRKTGENAMSSNLIYGSRRGEVGKRREKTGAKLADTRAAIGLTSTPEVPGSKILDLRRTSWWD
jgi:hypothetical protein